MAELDEQLLSSLEAVQDLQTLAQDVNHRLKDGFLRLSEARFGLRWNKINPSSFPPTIEPTMRVVLQAGADGEASRWVLQREEVEPAFCKKPTEAAVADESVAAAAAAGEPVGLRQRRPATDGGVAGGAAKGDGESPSRSTATSTVVQRGGLLRAEGGVVLSPHSAKDNTDPKRDPLGWFGLPSPALKRAQAVFREAFDQIPAVASMAREICLRTEAFKHQRSDGGGGGGGGGSQKAATTEHPSGGGDASAASSPSSPLPPSPGLIVGSYATSPNLFALERPDSGVAYDGDREAAFYDGLAALSTVGGLELQLDRAGTLHCFEEARFLREFARPRWKGVLTCIGGTLASLAADPAFGLASTDEAGRLRAVEFARKAHAAVQRWNARPGASEAGGNMVAVEVHSGPNTTKGTPSSAEAFARSLRELLSWDWQGARLVVEHCDAPGPAGHPPAKGFLPLDDDIAAVRAVNAAFDANSDANHNDDNEYEYDDSGGAKDSRRRGGQPVGLCINWARSVLETRDPATALQHVQRAKDAGVLAGLMFSGCTGQADSPYGPWKDCHMPHAPAAAAGASTATSQYEYAAEGSLMTAERIAACVRAAGPALLYRGCKITALHTGHLAGSAQSDVPVRVGLIRDLTGIIAAALGNDTTTTR
jgi:hypothetical protein